ncbi:copper homeostasis protein CutC [Winogradskyella sp. PC-19]|uniref:copper homeostasis protein CutC n=1 Tax=unclassified Winogradskyella TaxID=2615021 RepID=UPI000B3C69B6|nr:MULTISPECIES: copper homeostasis protein CutC [unclassified Winogradskyella]ARV09482.1 copper homeostasis protein CutC [Winogradskyella sp. PC-19]
MLLEVCANSYQSAKNAQDAGVHRIELCQELSVGGITPSYGLLKQVVENLDIQVFVLIRPRSGNFVYSDAEFEIMKKDIQLCKDLGCEGIVSGVLNLDKTIDIKRTKELVELSKPLAFTFHRAFDEVINPEEALEQLINLGVERVLTSGQKSSAEEGLGLIKELHEIANDRIIILSGGGISPKNTLKFKAAGLKEIHASVSKKIEQEHSIFGMTQTVSDIQKIKDILNEI